MTFRSQRPLKVDFRASLNAEILSEMSSLTGHVIEVATRCRAVSDEMSGARDMDNQQGRGWGGKWEPSVSIKISRGEKMTVRDDLRYTMYLEIKVENSEDTIIKKKTITHHSTTQR